MNSFRRSAAVFAATVLTIASCASAPDYVGEEIFDHRGKRRLEAPSVSIAIDGDRATVTSPFIPGISFSGFVADDTGETVIYLTDARLFGNWSNGWTEGFYEASGVLALERIEAGRWRVRIDDPPDLWSITSGEIRYYDDYILGEEGTTKVRTRVDRLEAYARWLRENGGEPFYGDVTRAGEYGPAYRPELVAAIDPGVPESIARLVESGTFERDIREAPTLALAIYNLDYFVDDVLGGVVRTDRED
jgi:hypothetical protein